MKRDSTPHRKMRGVCHLPWPRLRNGRVAETVTGELAPRTCARADNADRGGRMKAMVWMVATTIGGAVGWWLGAFVGIFTAVSLSAVGSGVALFYAQRLANEYLP
jgi:hypothetical protein